MTMIDLKNARCEPISPKQKSLIIPTIESYLTVLPGWEVPLSYQHIEKTFKFKNYYQVTAFVNAVTWIAHKEDHHPEICFGYNQCKITLTTHDIKGLSMNDLIMAAKIDALLEE
jgi:4a-hydroxytetrahydrobiopterin dehydratase